MPKTVNVKSTLEDASSVKAVWEANPDYRLSNTGLTEFSALYSAVKELDDDYTKKDVELSGALSKREEKARELHGLVVRFRQGMAAHFGPDSPEYGQAGGTRQSQRRSPNRRPKARPRHNRIISVELDQSGFRRDP